MGALWYNCHCLDEQNTGALFFQSLPRYHNLFVGKKPPMCGHASQAVRLGNGSAHGGLFAMIPTNEVETIAVFAQVCEAMGVEIVSLQSAFPDAIVRVRATNRKYRAEFEYQSSSFRAHRHDPRKCDLIICWAHDLEDCRLPVWELRDWKSADIVLAQEIEKEVMYWKMMYELAQYELSGYKSASGKKPQRQKQTYDWRSLSSEDRLLLAKMSTKEIVAAYAVKDRTARNWAAAARKNGHG